MSDDLRQADLSGLSVEQMSVEQKAELRRRFQAFVADVWVGGRKAAAPARPERKIRPWLPTKRA